MNEREPDGSPEPIPIDSARRRRASPRSARWKLNDVAAYLNATRTPVHDQLFGEGSRLMLGPVDEPIASLELYPQRAAARLRLPNMLLELSPIAAPLIPEDPADSAQRLFIASALESATDLRLGISPTGQVSLLMTPKGTLPVEQSPQLAEPAGADAAQSPETEAQPRVSVRGKVGAAPTFRSTPKGVLIARFPLAERQEETTRWHRVIAFSDRAEQLRDAPLAKGQDIEVVGYVHQRQFKGRDGESKLIEEVYAAVIKPVPTK